MPRPLKDDERRARDRRVEASGDRQGRPNVLVTELASENIVGEPRTHELLGGQIGHHERLSKALVGDLGGK